MVFQPLTQALCKLLFCDPKNLVEILNHPEAINRVTEFLKNKKLVTCYQDKEGEKKEVKFGSLSLKSVSKLYAFEGYLDVKIIQYYYVKYRIRLLYPDLKCVVEYHNKGHCKYFPIELLAVEVNEEDETPEILDPVKSFQELINYKCSFGGLPFINEKRGIR